MKTSKWILSAIHVLSFFVFLGVLGTCNLLQKPEETKGPFYRLMASGFGAVISTNAGYYYRSHYSYSFDFGTTQYTYTNSTEEVVPWGSNGNYSEGGWWQKEIPEDEVRIQKTADEERLFLQAVNQGGAGGPLTTRIVYVDDKGNESVRAEVSTQENTCISSAWLWTSPPSGPPDPFHEYGYHETVICTELHRQGLMDEAIFEADAAFGKHLRETQNEVLIGYHFWAKPVVRLMQKSRVFTQIVNVLAQPWSYEMAYRMGARDKGTFAGKILMDVGVPVCRTIGKVAIWAGNTCPRDDAEKR